MGSGTRRDEQVSAHSEISIKWTSASLNFPFVNANTEGMQWAGWLGLVSFWAYSAQAGVFNIPEFVEPGNFAVGLEPELTFSHGAGIAGNLKYTQGLTGFSNLTALVGTGTGPRKFRVGADLSFDFFPDVEKQPGLGLATQILYQRLVDFGQLEITLIPYLHKSFTKDGSLVDPFVAVPFGWAFHDGEYKPISTLVIGGIFKTSESVKLITEFGIAINNSETYLSGGIAYYH